MKKLFVILVITFIRNKHNASTEIHAFFEETRSTAATPCGMVKNGANDPPRPTTQPFYRSEQRLCTLLYAILKDRFTSIQELSFQCKIFQLSYEIYYANVFASHTLKFNK